ncbi:hypothetical protein BDR26DRAFT_893577 [Obelidium mucronatum]|nr:hypothetical protein BDR26DRAFT_893577 [Obelidium mucronatum]
MDPDSATLFKSKAGNFRSPHVWVQNPPAVERNHQEDGNDPPVPKSSFSSAFGTTRLVLSSDPGGRTVETQQASSGHRIQIAPGFEHQIRYWQGQIDKLQSVRDSDVEEMDDVIDARRAVCEAERQLDQCLLGVGDVDQRDCERSLFDAKKEVDDLLDKKRKEAVTEEGILYSVRIKTLHEKLARYAEQVQYDAARWNSRADVYITSDFNSKSTNKVIDIQE